MQSVWLEKENHRQSQVRSRWQKNVDGGLNLVEQFNVGCDLAQNSQDKRDIFPTALY